MPVDQQQVYLHYTNPVVSLVRGYRNPLYCDKINIPDWTPGIFYAR